MRYSLDIVLVLNLELDLISASQPVVANHRNIFRISAVTCFICVGILPFCEVHRHAGGHECPLEVNKHRQAVGGHSCNCNFDLIYSMFVM